MAHIELQNSFLMKMGMKIPNDEDKEKDSYESDYIKNNMNKFNYSNSNTMNNFNNLNSMMIQNNLDNMNQTLDGELNLNGDVCADIQKVDNNQIASSMGFVVIFRVSGVTGETSKPIMMCTTPEEKVSELIEKYRNKSGDREPNKKFIFNAKNLTPSLTCAEAGLCSGANIFVLYKKGIKGKGPWYEKEINIKFIKKSKNNYNNIFNCDLYELLKLCLLKEISSKISNDDLENLPVLINCIMRILKKGYIETGENIKKTIKEVFKKWKEVIQ